MTVRDLDQEIRDMFNDPLFWICICILISVIIIGITIFLYSHISNKIHRSFHKGYNKAKSDKVQYYKTIKEIIDSFKVIYDLIYSEKIEMKVSLAEALIVFKKLLLNYYEN